MYQPFCAFGSLRRRPSMSIYGGVLHDSLFFFAFAAGVYFPLLYLSFGVVSFMGMVWAF
jgi:hypothetical protein